MAYIHMNALWASIRGSVSRNLSVSYPIYVSSSIIYSICTSYFHLIKRVVHVCTQIFTASSVQYELPRMVTKEKEIVIGSQTYIQLENEVFTTTAASKAPMSTGMFTPIIRSIHGAKECL